MVQLVLPRVLPWLLDGYASGIGVVPMMIRMVMVMVLVVADDATGGTDSATGGYR